MSKQKNLERKIISIKEEEEYIIPLILVKDLPFKKSSYHFIKHYLDLKKMGALFLKMMQ